MMCADFLLFWSLMYLPEMFPQGSKVSEAVCRPQKLLTLMCTKIQEITSWRQYLAAENSANVTYVKLVQILIFELSSKSYL